MELIITMAMKFWQWTVLIAVVILAAIFNALDKRKKPNLKFNFKGMPKLQPVPIKTKGKGFWKGIIMWLLSTRNWVLTDDWKYNCLLYTSPSPRDGLLSRMPSSA